MRFVCISDTHTLHDNITIPDGDVLIHAGDFTHIGELNDIKRFNEFLGRMPHKYKIVIAGNHDFSFQNSPEEARALLTNCIYLEDSEITIENIRIYGTPWHPAFDNWAFGLPRGQVLKEKWDLIPQGIDILITHSPPSGILDKGFYGSWGCDDLTAAVQLIKPKYHIFGHTHLGYGTTTIEGITFINASICDGNENPINAPIVFDYEKWD